MTAGGREFQVAGAAQLNDRKSSNGLPGWSCLLSFCLHGCSCACHCFCCLWTRQLQPVVSRDRKKNMISSRRLDILHASLYHLWCLKPAMVEPIWCPLAWLLSEPVVSRDRKKNMISSRRLDILHASSYHLWCLKPAMVEPIWCPLAWLLSDLLTFWLCSMSITNSQPLLLCCCLAGEHHWGISVLWIRNCSTYSESMMPHTCSAG